MQRRSLDRLTEREAALAARPPHELTDAELREYAHACLRLWKRGEFSWWQRRHWRRAFARVNAALMERATARVRTTMRAGMPCERCEREQAKVHRMVGKGADERIRHLCPDCEKREPAGWFALAET